MNRLATRIESELGDVQISVNRASRGWQTFKQSGDDLYLDSIALNLQSVYTGLERLFEQIARNIDRTFPDGENWHQQLLEQMATEQNCIRPAVVSSQSFQCLDELRRFRHLVRHNYAADLEKEQTNRLVDYVGNSFGQITAELMAFAKFLEQQSQG